jgi:hypothetical protein
MCSIIIPELRVLIPPPRLFTPRETKALAKSKVHQWLWAWLTNVGWSSSLISKIWRTVMNSGHWLVQFKVYIITTAWRQRNSKHFLIWWLINFLQIYFIFARFCKFQKLSQKERAKESAKRRKPTLTNVSLFVNIDFTIALKYAIRLAKRYLQYAIRFFKIRHSIG